MSLNVFAPGSLFSDGHPHVIQRDLGLPDRPQRDLVLDLLGVVARRAFLHEESLDPAVLDVAGPHHDDIGDGAVADPLLRAVDHVGIAVAARRGLQCDRVGPVVGLGERERADLLQPGHRRQPLLLLLLGAQHEDRLHREATMDHQECAHAPVAPGHLHRDQPSRHRIHVGAAVADDPVTDDPDRAELLDQRPRELGFLPVFDDGRVYLGADELSRPREVVRLLRGHLLPEVEVVSAQGVTDADLIEVHAQAPLLTATDMTRVTGNAPTGSRHGYVIARRTIAQDRFRDAFKSDASRLLWRSSTATPPATQRSVRRSQAQRIRA